MRKLSLLSLSLATILYSTAIFALPSGNPNFTRDYSGSYRDIERHKIEKEIRRIKNDLSRLNKEIDDVEKSIYGLEMERRFSGQRNTKRDRECNICGGGGNWDDRR